MSSWEKKLAKAAWRCSTTTYLGSDDATVLRDGDPRRSLRSECSLISAIVLTPQNGLLKFDLRGDIMTLRSTVYADETRREEFDHLYESVTSSLFNARTSSQDIARTWEEHARKIATGEIAQIRDGHLHIAESLDRELRRDVESFLNAASRTMKMGLQHLAKHLELDIGFLFRQQRAFDKGLAALEKIDPALAAYLRDTRVWSEPLTLLRNDLEHSIWSLPRVTYTRTGNGVRAEQPAMGGKPVTEFVTDSFDRLC